MKTKINGPFLLKLNTGRIYFKIFVGYHIGIDFYIDIFLYSVNALNQVLEMHLQTNITV